LIAREFYGNVLGLKEGRRAEDKWQDYSLNGHQIVCHFVGSQYRCADYYNPVDKDEVPVPHFGLVLTEVQFHDLKKKLEKHNTNFIVKPHKRFAGQPGEQWTMFFKDPSGNNLEFKSMTNPDYLFARYNVKE
jgi:extradiol dioxygenase family protein